jgi:hypothetical protein
MHAMRQAVSPAVAAGARGAASRAAKAACGAAPRQLEPARAVTGRGAESALRQRLLAKQPAR